MENTNTKLLSKRHILVMDDDPTFLRLFEAAAEKYSFAITSCGSLKELKAMGDQKDFDAVVVDYNLDDFEDYFTGADIARGFGATPVILISSNEQCIENLESWPTSVRKFLHKRTGIDTILHSVVKSIHRL